MSHLSNPFDAVRKKFVAHKPLKAETVLQSVIDTIMLVSHQADVKPDHQLFADCGLDSLDIVDVQMTLEELYSVDLDWDEFWAPRRFDWLETQSYSATVKDLADFLERGIG